MVIAGFVDVIAKCIFAGEEAKVLGFDSNEPKSEFPTRGTIASIGFVRGFDIRFEFDRAAYAASVVLFCCHCVTTDKEKGDKTMDLRRQIGRSIVVSPPSEHL